MSLCINPQCPQPDHPDNGLNRNCQTCGSDLLLQDRYRVMRLLSSQSGFGQVYAAYERNIPKILKVLKESHTTNEKVLELFQREALVLSRLHHPGVPQIEPDGYFVYHPAGNNRPLHCIVMEQIDGPNLRQWMVQQGNHPVSEQQALLWLTQLTDVLHLVHQQNYFHRDIKPENIMLRSSGQLVLVDFGAAREVSETYLAQLGSSGITTVSSAGYTPPEQEQGLAVPQSDFYALGRTIIYLLTAKTPNDPTVYDSRTNELTWRVHAPQVSQAFAQLIDDLIATRAIDRPQTTQAILERLATVKSAQPIVTVSDRKPGTASIAWPTTTLDPIRPPLELLRPATKVQSEAAPWRQRLLWPGILAGLALLGLLAGSPLIWRSLERSQTRVSQTQPGDVPVRQATLVKKLQGHTAPVKSLVLLSDRNTLISGSEDKSIRVWDLQKGKEVGPPLQGHKGAVNALVINPANEQMLFSAGADGTILMWDLASRKVTKTLAKAHDNIINALAISSDGKTLASADAKGVVKLWNAETGALIKLLVGQDTAVNALAFNQDNQSLASCSQALVVWDMTSGIAKTLDSIKPSFFNSLVFSSDGTLLISVGADKKIKLWDFSTGKNLATQTPHTGYINDVKVTRNGEKFISASADKTLGVWDMQSKQLLERVVGFDTDIYRFALLPNDQVVTAGGDDGNLRVWQESPK